MIFNFIAIFQLIAAALVALPIAGVLYLFGFDFGDSMLASALVICAPIDALYRLSQLFGDEEEGTQGNMWAPIAPRSGGHLFFIPMWVLGIALPAAFWWGGIF